MYNYCPLLSIIQINFESADLYSLDILEKVLLNLWLNGKVPDLRAAGLDLRIPLALLVS